MYSVLSPWPNQRNGIADYAYEIVKNSSGRVQVVTEVLRPKPIGDRVVFASSEDFAENPTSRRLYHFGNNPDHCFLVPLFLRAPGVAVIHDASLHYLAEKTDALIPGFFRRAVQQDVGEDANALLASWSAGLKQLIDYSEVPCLSWLRHAPDIIVHSEYGKRLVSGFLPGSRVHVIPHFAYRTASPNGLNARRHAARAALGISEHQFLISTLGFVTKNKQYDSVMRAISSLPEQLRTRVRYIIAGAVRLDEYDLVADITMNNADFVQVLDYVQEQTMHDLTLASDLIINLRYPTFGESSGSVARAMGAGAAIVVPDSGSFSEIPAEACFHVSPGQDVSAQLVKIIERCMLDPNELATKQMGALEYAYDNLSPRRCAEKYEDILYS